MTQVATEQTGAHLKGSRRGSVRAAAELKISPCFSITLQDVAYPVFLRPSGIIPPPDAPAVAGRPSPPPGRPRQGDGDPRCGKTVPPIRRTSPPGAMPQRESNRVSGYQPSPDRETGVKSKSARSGVLSLEPADVGVVGAADIVAGGILEPGVEVRLRAALKLQPERGCLVGGGGLGR